MPFGGPFTDRQFLSDVGQGLTDAGNRGAAMALGGPIDIATQFMNLLTAGGGFAAHAMGLINADQMPAMIENPVGGSEWMGQKLRDAGAVSDNRNPVAEILASMLLPGGVAKAGRGLHSIEEAATRNLSAPSKLGPMRAQRGVINWPGAPDKLYHGTAKDFDRFDLSLGGKNTMARDAEIGPHFSDNVAVADLYATMAAEKAGLDSGHIGIWNVDMEKPLVIGFDEAHGNVPGHLVDEFLGDKMAAAEYARAHGYDGIVYPQGTNVDSGYTAIALRSDRAKKIGKAR